MFLNKGVYYSAVYFLIFPIGFWISKLLDRWLDYINENIEGMSNFYMWILISGLLAALFLQIMLVLHSRIIKELPSYKWLSAAICVFHLLLGLFIAFAAPSQILIALFGYMFSTRYVTLIVILLFLILANLLTHERKKLKNSD